MSADICQKALVNESGMIRTQDEDAQFIRKWSQFTGRLWHGIDGFISPLKEGVLRNFIALKNPSTSAGFEPANLGFSGKHDNHYTTEGDKFVYYGKGSMLLSMNNINV
jgi:hypothetical protein